MRKTPTLVVATVLALQGAGMPVQIQALAADIWLLVSGLDMPRARWEMVQQLPLCFKSLWSSEHCCWQQNKTNSARACLHNTSWADGSLVCMGSSANDCIPKTMPQSWAGLIYPRLRSSTSLESLGLWWQQYRHSALVGLKCKNSEHT